MRRRSTAVAEFGDFSPKTVTYLSMKHFVEVAISNHTYFSFFRWCLLVVTNIGVVSGILAGIIIVSLHSV